MERVNCEMCTKILDANQAVDSYQGRYWCSDKCYKKWAEKTNNL